MFQVGELIIYGNNGICRVEEIGTPNLPIAAKGAQYYTLAPLFRSGVIYAPVDTKIFMRPILTKAEAERLIEQIPEIHEEITDGQSIRSLGETYKSFLHTHQCEDLVRLIKTIYKKEQAMEERGKKLAKTEQDYSKLAKELLHQEFSLALEIPYEEVQEYITARVENLAK